MAESLHPAAENHLPMFITTPGQADVLFILMAVFVLAAVIGLGVIYFRLHALPEQVAAARCDFTSLDKYLHLAYL